MRREATQQYQRLVNMSIGINHGCGILVDGGLQAQDFGSLATECFRITLFDQRKCPPRTNLRLLGSERVALCAAGIEIVPFDTH